MMEEKNTEKLSRRMIRQHTFSLLYSLGFYGEEDYEQAAEQYVRSASIEDNQDRDMICREALAVMGMRERIDAMIDEQSAHWKTKRIAKVDLAIIRLGVYEMLCDDEVPVSVAINEAVRLAKKYSSEQAPAFVNGVLAALVPEQAEESSCPEH